MGLLYTGRVMRVDPGGPVIRVPLLGRDALWGPVVSLVGGLAVDEQIIVGQLGTSRDQLVVLGRLHGDGGLDAATERLVAVERMVEAGLVRVTSLESQTALLTRSDARTAAALTALRQRLDTVEYSASNLPAVIAAATGDSSAAITQLQSDVSALRSDMTAVQSANTLLRQDLTTAQSNITALESNQSGLLTRIGALESWRASGGSGGTGGTPAPSKPGDLINLTRWELTLPTGPSASNPDDIYAGGTPDLVSYSNSSYFKLGSDAAGYYVECAAPVNGTGIVTTSSASGASRAELREMASASGGPNGPKAGWSPTDGLAHSMTVTMKVDPTSITNGRKEVICGQIHGASGTPPLYLTANFNATPVLTIFKNGSSSEGGNVLSGLTADSLFTVRIVKTAGNRVQLSYALGGVSALPATPQYDWAASAFTDNTGWYFKIGAYNKTPIDDADASGVGRVRLYRVDLDSATGSTGGGTSTPVTTTMGKTTDGTSSSASSSDKTAVSKWTAAASGVLTAGHARAWVGGAPANTKVVVYADSAGAPGAKLGESDVLVITGTTEAQRDYVFSGANKANIVTGTDYHVGLAWQDPGTAATDTLNLSRDATTAGRNEASLYAPATFGTPVAATGPVDVWVDVVG